MTRLELRDALETRVGWEQPDFQISGVAFALSAANLTTDGGRVFQSSHELVKISTIYEIMEKISATADELNTYLERLRLRVVQHVVDESFAGVNFNDVDLTLRPNLFDAAIEKRMAMKVYEILEAAVRHNRTKRITQEAVRQFFFDINGDTNYKNKISISYIYKKEIEEIRDFFNSDYAIDVMTMTNIRSDYNDDFINLNG